MNETPGPEACQVRSKTGSPCPHRAVVEIRGVPFCGECAGEQEAYFAIGELTQGRQVLRGKALAEALKKMRRRRAGTGEGMVAQVRHGLPRARERAPRV